MEEKNLKEGQVAEQTTSQQDENKNMSDVDALKAEIKKLNETIDYLRTLLRPSLSALAGSTVSDNVGIMFDNFFDNNWTIK